MNDIVNNIIAFVILLSALAIVLWFLWDSREGILMLAYLFTPLAYLLVAVVSALGLYVFPWWGILLLIGYYVVFDYVTSKLDKST